MCKIELEMSIQNNFKLIPIDDLAEHHFFIPNYQRGYKWDVQQVLDLLNDLNEFKQVGKSFYCLQPLAVTKSGTTKQYEVIDGQQRLTTIHIILQIIAKSIYTIKYQTRKRSEELLTAITLDNNFGLYRVKFTSDIQALKKNINKEWAKYIDIKKKELYEKQESENINEFDNIDFYYFFTAFLTIKSWIDAKAINKSAFTSKLLEQTKFIWYNETNEKKPKRVYRNLNSGKISLTNAELIKALFVNNLKDKNKQIQQLQQSAFAIEWDMIETTLQDDLFWYFISNEKANHYDTRIDYLFELETRESKKNKFYTYRYYDRKLKNAKTDDRLVEFGNEWKKIRSLFLTLREWYKNEELYHLIGYLTTSWNQLKPLIKIEEIVKKSNGINKVEFKNCLICQIHKKVFNIKDEDGNNILIDQLAYGDNDEKINRILLLHNIETYCSEINGFRFPFKDFKALKWSLEHIHAQQSEKVKTVEELKIWIGNDTEKIVAEIKKNQNGNHEQLEKNIAALEKSYANQEPTDKITEIQKNLLVNIEEYLEMHQIWNMALLDIKTNSSLNNKPFIEKRKLIIDKVKNNAVFIPICTRNVFLKVYTTNLTQINYWSYQDRKDYLDDMTSKLDKYINFQKPRNI